MQLAGEKGPRNVWREFVLLGAAGLPFVAMVGGIALNQALKHIINRDRPDALPPLAEVGNSSYPSGHSMLSARADDRESAG